MKWIKASERLPDMEQIKLIKCDIGMYHIGNFYHEQIGNEAVPTLSINGNGAHDGFIVKNKYLYKYFWLDETPSASPSLGGDRRYASEIW